LSLLVYKYLKKQKECLIGWFKWCTSGQEFGANEYHMLGIYLQSSCIISFISSIIISIILHYTEHILVLLHQSQDIAKTVELYMKFLIPGLFAYNILQNMLRFLQTQSIVMPLVILSAIPALVHVGITYGFVEWTSLNFIGGPIATSISLWIPHDSEHILMEL
jgi:MATE family multidrug resistance protein